MPRATTPENGFSQETQKQRLPDGTSFRTQHQIERWKRETDTNDTRGHRPQSGPQTSLQMLRGFQEKQKRTVSTRLLSETAGRNARRSQSALVSGPEGARARATRTSDQGTPKGRYLNWPTSMYSNCFSTKPMNTCDKRRLHVSHGTVQTRPLFSLDVCEHV